MYTLYKERYYVSKGEKVHEVEKVSFDTFESAREDMLADYDQIVGNFDKLLFNGTFIARRYTNGICDLMILYGILKND